MHCIIPRHVVSQYILCSMHSAVSTTHTYTRKDALATRSSFIKSSKAASYYNWLCCWIYPSLKYRIFIFFIFFIILNIHIICLYIYIYGAYDDL
jgi:hypothetical protein